VQIALAMAVSQRVSCFGMGMNKGRTLPPHAMSMPMLLGLPEAYEPICASAAVVGHCAACSFLGAAQCDPLCLLCALPQEVGSLDRVFASLTAGQRV
jgi:hypothetical protein